MQPTGPTPYPDVNALLARLLADLRAALGAQLAGLYLYGSLSLGDFDPASSDVDFLVATRDQLPGETLAALAAMHARIADSDLPLAQKLEGSYIPLAALRRHDPADAVHPTIGLDWDFGPAEHGGNWVIERHIVREPGVTVWGPPPATLIDPVPPAALRAATRDALRGFWARQLHGPDWLRTRDYQAFAILTMCRALHLLATGAVASKPAAAAWARAEYPAWAALIGRALVWRHDRRPDDMADVLAFVRWMVARVRGGDGEYNT